ncbi:Serine/threonine-protein kinase-like protein [Paramyrothecium foliicola]|nr:Serine/threonine-protein kinase-like protein [Paramyrothecium foliicola]
MWGLGSICEEEDGRDEDCYILVLFRFPNIVGKTSNVHCIFNMSQPNSLLATNVANSHLDANVASVDLPTENPRLVKCPEPYLTNENTSSSSTNPHPEEYLNERLAKLLAETDDDAQPSDSIFHFREEAYFEDISLEDLDPNTRVVVAPVTDEALDFSTSYGTVPLRFPRVDAGVLMITQSSKNADFTLSFGQHTFNFVYDSASDSLFIRNMNARSYVLERFTAHNGIYQESCQSLLGLEARSTLPLDPGVWQIGTTGEVFCKLLLAPRRYIVRRGKTASPTPGSKRGATPLAAAHPKRNYSEARTTFGEYLTTGEIAPTDGHLSIVNTGNALASLELGDYVTVWSERQSSNAPESDSHPASTLAHPHIHFNVTENYTISHKRDIAVNKANSSVYRAIHSAHGDVAVKVIRRKHVSAPSSRAKIAQEWRREELVLRSVSHSSIIRLLGSDARFYSLYLEHVPDSDLTAHRDTKAGHFFTGDRNMAVSVLCQIGSALAYLHANSILHNDVKPGNILWAPGRGAILIDFGLADTCTSAACNGGTPFYIPMEYLVSNERGTGSDVFALGVTLLYLLGKIPLPEVTERSWIIAETSEPSERERMISWLRKINQKSQTLADFGIERIVKEALTMDPKRRISAERIVWRSNELHCSVGMSNEVYSGATKDLHAFKISVLALLSQFELLVEQYHHLNAGMNPDLTPENRVCDRSDELSSGITLSTQTAAQTFLARQQNEPNQHNQNQRVKAQMIKSFRSSIQTQFQGKYNSPMQKTFYTLSKSVEGIGNLLRRSRKAFNTLRLASCAGSPWDADGSGNSKIRPNADLASLPVPVSAYGIEKALKTILVA